MTPAASRWAAGFSLIELLVAMTICAIVSAGVAIAVPPARAVFGSVPAEIELQQRARTAVDSLSQAIRAAGGDAVAADELGPLASVIPAVIPYDPVNGYFTRLNVVGPHVDAAQGILDRHQDGAFGQLRLAISPCPDVPVVCGFTRGATALITDGSGRFDVFVVSSVDAANRALIADRAFFPPYAAGSVIIEADADTFQLDEQPDRSHTLVRVSAAGAVQPIIDGVERLTFEVSSVGEAGGLTPLSVGTLNDGPWLRGLPGGLYDEDVFRIRFITVALTLRAVPPADTRRSIRFGVVLRNVR